MAMSKRQEFKSMEVARTQIYVTTHLLLKSQFNTQLLRPLGRVVVGMVFDIGCLRVKLMFSRGN